MASEMTQPATHPAAATAPPRRPARRFHFQSLRHTLMVYFFLLIVPSVVVSVAVLTHRAGSLLQSKYEESVFNDILQAQQNIDASLSASEGLFASLYLDRTVRTVLEERVDIDTTAGFAKARQATEKLTLLSRTYPMVDALYVYDLNDDCLYSAEGTMLLGIGFDASEMYRETVGRDNYARWTYVARSPSSTPSSAQKREMLVCAWPVNSLRNQATLGYVFAGVSAGSLRTQLAPVHIQGEGRVFVADQGGQVVAWPGAEEGETAALAAGAPGEGQDRLRTSLRDTGQDLYTTRSSATGLLYGTLIPAGRVQGEVASIVRVAALICLLVILLAVLLSLLFVRQIYRPMGALVEAMGNFAITRAPATFEERRDEFGTLFETYNRMVVNNHGLMEDLLEQQRREKDMQIRLHEEQIDPHFLYNSLNSIYCLAKLHGAEEITALSSDMINFYRLSLAGGADSITIADTARHLEYYIHIMRVRYRKPLRLRCDIDPDLAGVKIPKLIVQPLVENAVEHGLKDAESPGPIEVSVYGQEGDIHFTVADYGRGIPPDKLEAILQAIQQPEAEDGELFALTNVNQRLCLQYGPASALHIYSQPGRGTVVEFSIPAPEEETDV